MNSGISISKLEKTLSQLISEWQLKYIQPQANTPQWIFPPLSCEFLKKLAQLTQNQTTSFEFGSGCSTHALRSVCHSVTSIEDSQEWLSKTETIKNGIYKRGDDFTQVVPLVKCWNRMRPIQSFDLESHGEIIDRLQQSYLILSDSPPNPAKREHALFMSLQHAPVGAIIVLDDLEVSATQRFALRLAKQNQQSFKFWHIQIEHQLGVYFKQSNSKIYSVPSPMESIGTWLRA